MTESLDAYSGETIARGTMTDEGWKYLSGLALRMGGELVGAPAPEQDPGSPVVSLREFHEHAIATYGGIAQGSKAYACVLRVAQDQYEADEWTINRELPPLIFRTKPRSITDKNRPQHWGRQKEEFADLEVSSLAAYLTALDARLEAAGTAHARKKIYYRLGRTIGPTTLRFWREMVANHTDQSAVILDS